MAHHFLFSVMAMLITPSFHLIDYSFLMTYMVSTTTIKFKLERQLTCASVCVDLDVQIRNVPHSR